MKEDVQADRDVNSDGIARVHGMSNVQAEELVEYVLHITYMPSIPLTAIEVRLRRQGHVHEPRSRPGRCCAFRFRQIGQGG